MKNLVNVALINNYIKDKGLTKSQFCKRCNITILDLNNVMNAIYDFNVLFRISRELNITMRELTKT